MKWGKGILIVFGALVITALGIDAADTIQGSQGTLLSQVISTNKSGCPVGMAGVENIPGVTCVDVYEESAHKDCPVLNPDQVTGTIRNLEQTKCIAESKKDTIPWRFVTRDQAMQLCARSGKRLPTSDEWYALGLGMAQVESSCNINSKNIQTTGSSPDCVSPNRVFDLVGNVWEWVGDDVINGQYKGNVVPGTGYVAQVDSSGFATIVSEDPQELFGKDYFWSKSEGAFGMIRGGYYDSGTDGGLYTIHADTPPTTAGTGIGFRCVK